MNRVTEKRLFLKWALTNAVFVVFLTTLAVTFADRLHGVVVAVIPLIVATGGWGSYLAGKIAWKADGVKPGSRVADELIHEAHYLDHWAWVAPMLGILSSIAGMSVLLSSNNAATLSDRITSGGGAIFYGTFVGVLVMLLLKHMQRMIEHELARR